MTSYSKGRREEEGLVRLLRAHGIEAERVPLSGALHRRRADVLANGLCLSVKYGSAAPPCLFRNLLGYVGPYLVVPLLPLLQGWVVPGKELPRAALPKSVAEELAQADLLVARPKGGEWVVCGPPEKVFRLGGVEMYLSEERVEEYVRSKGFEPVPGFGARLMDLAFSLLEGAMEAARKEGRKELRLTDLPKPKEAPRKGRAKPQEKAKETLVLREEIHYRRPFVPVERKEGTC